MEVNGSYMLYIMAAVIIMKSGGVRGISHYRDSTLYIYRVICTVHIQSDSVLMDITARNDFLGVYDQ